MKPNAFILGFALLLTGCSHSSAPKAPAQPAEFTVERVGSLPPYPSSKSAAINNADEVVGRCYMIGGASDGLKWIRGRITNFGSDDKVIGDNGINDNGEIVGEMMQNHAVRAFLWDGAHVVPLNAGPASIQSGAAAVNNTGIVAGWSRFTPSQQFVRAVIWRHHRPVTLSSPGRLVSSASGINDLGEVSGWTMVNPVKPRFAAIWISGVMKDLDHPKNCNECAANAINNRGDVVGYMMLPGERRHACLWRNGHLVDLGTLGGKDSEALGINNGGDVVGWALTSNRDRHAFLYRHNKMVDLNTLIPSDSGWLLRSAAGINDTGAIAGSGMQLTPSTPDPATETDPDGGATASEFSAFVLIPTTRTRIANRL